MASAGRSGSGELRPYRRPMSADFYCNSHSPIAASMAACSAMVRCQRRDDAPINQKAPIIRFLSHLEYEIELCPCIPCI